MGHLAVGGEKEGKWNGREERREGPIAAFGVI